jgi:hypothetical protein
MRHLLTALLSLFVVVIPPAKTQTKADEEAVPKLPQAFSDAWIKHDGHELAQMTAGDVDFVTVATTYLHCRSDVEKFHVWAGALRTQRLRHSRQPCVSCVRIWPLSIGVGRLRAIKMQLQRCANRATA